MSNPTHTFKSILSHDYTNSPGSLGFIRILKEDGTEAYVRYDVFVAGLFKVDTLAMMKLHAALGVAGEAGELGDAIKKEVIYNKGLDWDNLIEELGDLRFYIQAVQNIYQISEQQILQANANKLSKRYKDNVYSDSAAIARADKAGSSSSEGQEQK